MIIRSPQLGVDEALCALQGYAEAAVVNLVKGAPVFNPLNGAILFGGVCYLEKLFFRLTSQYVAGTSAYLGPIPIGLKNFVSYGLATYTTLLIMRVAGLILTVPPLATLVGIACGLILGISYLMTKQPIVVRI